MNSEERQLPRQGPAPLLAAQGPTMPSKAAEQPGRLEATRASPAAASLDAGATRYPPWVPLTGLSLQVPGYEILGELGRGGMGVVYKARHLGLNRLVALKMIKGGHDGNEERLRFLAEAEAVAALQHVNVVQVFDYGEHNGLPFMALEYMDGGSLHAKLHEGLPSPREAAWLVEHVARGIHAAHARGIIHRDLKPANVLLRRKSEIQNSKSEQQAVSFDSDFGFRISDFEPKVSDFGLMKKVVGGNSLTQTGIVMGTPSYMAPEQAEG